MTVLLFCFVSFRKAPGEAYYFCFCASTCLLSHPRVKPLSPHEPLFLLKLRISLILN